MKLPLKVTATQEQHAEALAAECKYKPGDEVTYTHDFNPVKAVGVVQSTYQHHVAGWCVRVKFPAGLRKCPAGTLVRVGVKKGRK